MPDNGRRAPRVTIITVVFNARELLAETIRAIDKLDYPDLEHVIVDGGSTDGTADLLNAPRKIAVSTVSEPDCGIYDAMNKGMRLARGDYIWFLNAGDTPASSDILDALLESDTPDVLYGDTTLVDPHGRLVKIVRAPANLSASIMVWGMLVSHQSIALRRDLAPLYDLQYRYIADQKWIVDGLKEAKTIRYLGKPMSNYLTGGLSEQNYSRAWLEKVRYNFNDCPLSLAIRMTFWGFFSFGRFHAGSFYRFVLRKRRVRAVS